jgi:hypothetical protein
MGIKDQGGKDLARLSLLMDIWQKQSLYLEEKGNFKKTKRNINLWLEEFEQIFFDGVMKPVQVYGYEGFANVNLSSERQGGESRENIELENYLAVYASQNRIMRGKVLTQARLLRNTLATSWIDKKQTEAFYQRWDDYLKETNALGFSLQKQTETFLVKDANKAFTHLTDSGGRKWKPNHYSTMYARTRGREIEDIVRVDECRELGVNMVQVTNANTTTPICLNYEGKYYYLDTPIEGFQKLPIRPPFHPNCVHRILPVVRENMTKYKKVNNNKDKKYNRLSNDFTDSQKKYVDKQITWNLDNRIQV